MRCVQHRWCAAALVSVAGSALAATPAGVIPTGVAQGTASFTGSAGETVITASDGAVINYSRFDIAAGDSVRFIQPGADARVLNRVNSPDASLINGTLSANGVVYLVNPSGVIFGPDAVVSVAGLVAAAANLSDADFLAGTDRFVTSGGVVSNLGVIRADDLVHLVGARALNLGTIVAPQGVVTMSAGETVYLGEAGGRLMVEVSGGPAAGPGVEHRGAIDAGEALFTTGDLYALALGGTTHAGAIGVSGGAVSLTDATLDTPGDGGSITVDGASIFVDADSVLRADGDAAGGRVVLRADDALGVYGELSARGGPGGGGFIETSAGRALRVDRAPDVSSPAGGGTWLIDPHDLTIVLDGLGSAGVTPTAEGFAATADGAQIEVGTVVAGLLGGDVVLMTTPGGAGAGDITLLATLDFDGVTGSTLTLEAHNDIVLSRDILDTTFGDGDGLNLVLRADSDLSGAGGVRQNRDLELGTGTLTATGAFYDSAPTSEIIASSASIDTAGGTVVPGRVFLTGPLSVRAAGDVTFQPGAVIAGSVDSRSGLDGTGDTLFAAGDLQINAPVISFRAGVPGSGSARVRIADNTPRLQGAAFGSRPSDFAIAQSASLTSGDLPLLSRFGAGTLTSLSGMDYTAEALGAGRDLTITDGGRLRGADLRLEAGRHVTVSGPLTAGALIVRSDTAGGNTGRIELDAAVTAAGGVHRGIAVDADLAGWGLTTAGSLAAQAVGLSFTGDAALVTSGDAVITDPLAGTSGAAGSLRVESLGGDIRQTGSLTLNATDAAFLAAGGSIDLPRLGAGGAVRLVSAGDAVVVNTGALEFGGGDSEIGGALDAETLSGSITDDAAVRVAGDTRLTSADAVDLDTLDAAGTVFLVATNDAAVVNAQALDLGTGTVGGALHASTLSGAISDSGAVSVGAGAVFETLGAGSISLGTTAASSFALTTADGDASLAGGSLVLDHASIAGDFVLDSSAYTLAGDVSATGDARLGGEGVASGLGDQHASAGGDLTLTGALRKSTVGDLTLEAGGLMTLGGDLDASAGSLRLNPLGRPGTPDRATIAGVPAGLGVLKLSAAERVELGRREKLTVLGGLTVTAGTEIITGDLNALGDMTLTAPTITLLTREPARLLEPDGSGVSLSASADEATDLIAGGRLDINTGVLRVDGGDGEPILATDGDAITGAGPLRRRSFDGALTLLDFQAAGIVLDLAAPPATGSLDNPAGLEGDAEREIERPPALDPAAIAGLARLGVPARSPLPAESTGAVAAGRGLYDDVSTATGGASTDRLSGTVARSLVERYDALAGPGFERVPAVRDSLAGLYAAFLAQAPADEARSGAAFGEFIRDQRATSEIDAIAEIDRLLGRLGLTEPELNAARRALLGRFLPVNLDVDTLRGAAAFVPEV